jgi:hypothetical protein
VTTLPLFAAPPTMPIAGQLTRKCGAFVTHNDDWDMLLIRIGHFIWRNYKKTRELNYLAACESVWAAKRAYRKPIRERHEGNHNAAAERLRSKKHKETQEPSKQRLRSQRTEFSTISTKESTGQSLREGVA